MEDPVRRTAAEFVGTFALVFIGAGSIITAGAIGDPPLSTCGWQDCGR